MNASTIVMAQLEVHDCTAELYVNDVPALRIAPPKLHLQNIAVEQLLVPGSNRLELLVEPLGRPSRARIDIHELPYRPMSAIGRLIRFPEGADGTVEHGQLLAETAFEWAPYTKRTFPVVAGVEVDLGMAHGRWAWQDAPLLRLDAALADEAVLLLERVAAILRALDGDAFWRITERQLRDVRRAYPAITEAEMRRHLGVLMAYYAKVNDPVMAFDRAKHDFRVVGDGKLLQLIDQDWTTSFKLRDPGDGSPVPYDIFVARLDGELTIVR